MKSIKVKTFAGTELEARYSYTEKMIDKTAYADGWNINTGKDVYKEEEMIFVSAKGEKFKAHIRFAEKWMQGMGNDKALEIGVDRYFISDVGNDHFYFIFAKEELEKIDCMMHEEKEENMRQEVKEHEEKEEQEKAKVEHTEAIEVMKAAETTPKKQNGELMNLSEAVEWIKKYREDHYEGGEGYIPPITTIEEVRWAKEILEKVE